MQFLAQYGLFLAKTITIIGGLLVLITAIAAISERIRTQKREYLTIKKLNDKYDEMAETINMELLQKKDFKKYVKQKKQQEKEAKKDKAQVKNIFVLSFEGDIRATAVDNLREEVSAILTVATPNDEVFVKVESGGGMIQTYGLAASQLARFRRHKIPLIVSVDKIAASGGYLMACVGNQILAAPFAIIGSIGVLAQLPNFHRFLKKHNIDFEQVTSGEFKRTLTVFGENTDKGRKKFQQELDDAHQLFKGFIHEYRPIVDIAKVATGEYWLGTRSKELNLVDELITSDDYLLNANKSAYNIYGVSYCCKQTLKDKLSSMVTMELAKLKNMFL